MVCVIVMRSRSAIKKDVSRRLNKDSVQFISAHRVGVDQGQVSSQCACMVQKGQKSHMEPTAEELNPSSRVSMMP